jgi:hypothetical protein
VARGKGAIEIEAADFRTAWMAQQEDMVHVVATQVSLCGDMGFAMLPVA